MQAEKRRKATLLSIFLTFFVDSLGWSLVFPIFAPLFLDINDQIFATTTSIATRTTVLGVFLAAFPFAQFFGAPLLGDVADYIGRKRALILSIFSTFIGYLLTGWSIYTGSLSLLFFSRILTGLFSGNLAVCMAAVADVSATQKVKVKLFSALALLAGLSFIMGVFIGGSFSDESLSSYFSPSLPFWIAAALALFNLLFLFWGFKESFSSHEKPRYDLLESVKNIGKILKTKSIKRVYSIYFLFLFSWTMLFQFTPVLVIRDFSFSSSQVGNTAVFIGICWAIGSFVFSKFLVKKFSTLKLLESSIIGYTVLSCLITFVDTKELLFPILGFTMIFAGIAWPLFAGLISSLSPEGSRGKVLGMSQSMQSLAMALSPIIGGLFSHLSLHWPFILAAIASLVAGLLYYWERKKISPN